MSLEWMHAHTPEVLIAGATIYKSEGVIDTPFALYFAPDGDGAVILGTREALIEMLDAARRVLVDSPDPVLDYCSNCDDYVDDPRIKRHGDGWRHITNNSVRCPGQEDDDTDDRVIPARYDD